MHTGWFILTVCNLDLLVEMPESREQLCKEHLTFPGCSHFRRLDDNHEEFQSCMYGGAPGCTRLSRCQFCADWTLSMWDAEERNRQVAVKRRIRKKDKKTSASSRCEATRPGYKSSSEIFPSRNPSPAHSRTSGYSGKGPSPKVRSGDETEVKRGRSLSRGRHGVDEDRIERVRSPSKAPRHEVWVERAHSPSPVCHERMEPSRSPSVPLGQERSPGVDTLLDYDERGLSDDDVIGYDEFPKGFSGSSPEQSCDDDKLLASPPRPPLTPLLVDSPKDTPGRVGIVCHREEAGSARALPPDDGKSRGPWMGHQGVATASFDEDSHGLRSTRGEALPPVDQEGPQRVNQDHAQDMNPLLWNPNAFVDQNGKYFQVVDTNLQTQSVLVSQAPILNQPAVAAGAPGQQTSDPKFTMKEFMVCPVPVRGNPTDSSDSSYRLYATACCAPEGESATCSSSGPPSSLLLRSLLPSPSIGPGWGQGVGSTGRDGLRGAGPPLWPVCHPGSLPPFPVRESSIRWDPGTLWGWSSHQHNVSHKSRRTSRSRSRSLLRMKSSSCRTSRSTRESPGKEAFPIINIKTEGVWWWWVRHYGVPVAVQHLQECCPHFQRRLLVSDPSWRRTCQGFHGPSFSGW